MKRTVFGMATLLLLSTAPCVANAFTAIAWSQSGQKGGSVKNAPTKEAAISAAIADCKKSGGGSDCQVFKVTDEPGFVALYATCAKTCGVTAVTGRPTPEQARADAKRECENHYRSACQLASEWQELKGGDALEASKSGPAVEDNRSIQNQKISSVEISELVKKHEAQLKALPKTGYIDKNIVNRIAFLIKSKQWPLAGENGTEIIIHIAPGLEPIWESLWSTGWYLNCKTVVKNGIDEWPALVEKEYKKIISEFPERNESSILQDIFYVIELKSSSKISRCAE